MAASACSKAATVASCIWAAETTSMRVTPSGVASDVGPETSVTWAPRLAAAAAMAYPIFPVEAFAM